MKLEYIGTVKGGEVKMAAYKKAKMKDQVEKAFEGKKVIITIERKKRSRSPQQNKYYWGVVIPIVANLIEYNGDMAGPMMVHEFLKLTFLDKIPNYFPRKIQGKSIYTTTDMTTINFMDYITLIQNWASEFGYEIPDPDELEGEFTNIDKQ